MPTYLSRRTVLAGAASALLIPNSAFAVGRKRLFKVYRGGSEVGRHSVEATAAGDRLTVKVKVDLAVKILGITAYRYTHRNREEWVAGALQTLTSDTDDDGDKAYVRLTRGDSSFEIDAAGYTGDLSLEAAPTSYWNHRALEAPVWFSTQSGTPLDVNIQKAGEEAGLSRWSVTGEAAIDLFYDDQNEWRGSRFDGKGEEITYEEVESGPKFLALL